MIDCRKSKVPSLLVKAVFHMLVIGAGFVVEFSVANDDSRITSNSPVPSLMASYTLSHQPSGALLAQFKLLVGSGGIRIDQDENDGQGSFILNKSLNKMWLLYRDEKIFHEVSLRERAEINALEYPVKEILSADESNVGDEYFSSFVHREPCKYMEAELDRDVQVNSGNVQVWICKDENKVVEKQWFDSIYGIVVKSESFDGIVSTLTDVSEISSVSEFLKPPINYRRVTLAELISISQPLNKYQNKNTLSGKSVRVNNSMTESTNAKNNRFTVQ